MSETLGSPLLVALVLLAAYRFWKAPGWRTVAWFGASIRRSPPWLGDELALLGPFALVPRWCCGLAWEWRKRAAYIGLRTLADPGRSCVPWVGYNLSRLPEAGLHQ